MGYNIEFYPYLPKRLKYKYIFFFISISGRIRSRIRGKKFRILIPALAPMGGFGPIFQSALRGRRTKFCDFFFRRDIRNKKVCKFKNFQVWAASRYFE